MSHKSMFHNTTYHILRKIISGFGSVLLIVLLWQGIVMITHVPSYLLPSPWNILTVMSHHTSLLFLNIFPTLFEAVLGLLLGSSIGFVLSILLILYPKLTMWFWPLVVIMQAVPTFAIAPILMIWFGFHLSSKVALCTLVIFFPVTSAFYDGLRRTPTEYREMNTIMHGQAWRFLWFMQIPYALPFFASGLKVTASYAIAGAALGEWIGSNKGLGFIMLQSNANFQIPLMFAALTFIMILTLVFYFVIKILLDRIIFWKS